MEKDKFAKLYTKEGENLTGMPHDEYPRPQLRRICANSEYTILNGSWHFTSKNNDCDILVPFCPESLLSGVDGKVIYGETLRYERNFTLGRKPENMRTILHFGAVSRNAHVYVNGREVCANDNAYLPFSADITDAVTAGENQLRVDAVNDLAPEYPHGKQRKKRGGMWYTPVSGIWQTVWIEQVPERYIAAVDIEADDSAAEISAVFAGKGSSDPGEFTAVCEGKEYRSKNGKVRIEPETKGLWSPENPRLYNVLIRTGEDEVETYFALRKLEIKTVGEYKRLCLNGEPYFFNAVLDQGYYCDGQYTPAALLLYQQDITRMKALGYNTLRKHIKIEPERFYYDCDRLGMIVFQDMVNNGYYSFVRDTALPTVRLRRRPGLCNSRRAVKENFLKAMEATYRHLKNHPSICLWTIFNEGWGQADADGAYRRLKSLDPTRFIDATSGWFTEHESDVDSRHIYFKELKPWGKTARPQVLSEFGGFVHKCPDNCFNPGKTYGYGIFESREEYAKEVRRKYTEEIIPLARQGLCAAVYTQVSDVEDEINGLLTYDRRVCKVLPEELRGIDEELQKAVRL